MSELWRRRAKPSRSRTRTGRVMTNDDYVFASICIGGIGAASEGKGKVKGMDYGVRRRE